MPADRPTPDAVPAASAPGRTRVAVVVLTFNSAPDVDDCFGSLARIDRTGLEVDLIAVDNASTDGTAAAIRQRHPAVHMVENPRNLGYAAGNNVGLRLALERAAEYVYLLNADTEVTPDFLAKAVRVARERPDAGSVQSLLLLWSERNRVNSAGNFIHFLGFGYVGGFRARTDEVGPEPREINYASGASALYRAAALREVGLLDEELFLYHEDLDLGWRLRLAGWRNLLAPASRVFHKYEFSRNPEKFYFMERNRHLVLLKNLEPRSLLALTPALAVAEVGLLALAAYSGWLPQKLRAYRYFLGAAAWRHLARERRRMRPLRRGTDREIVRLFTSSIDLEGVGTPALKRAANALLRLTWAMTRPLIR